MGDAPDDLGTREPVEAGTEAGDRLLSRRRLVYRTTTAVLALLIGAAVVDTIEGVDVYGVDTDHVVDARDGYELDVRYTTVSRPALASPFEITVRHEGGFEGPVVVAVDARYLSMWDENGLDPQPSAETTDGDALVWEFDPPEGESLTISYDARIEPAAQSGLPGSVEVRDPAGDAVVRVEFRTEVRP